MELLIISIALALSVILNSFLVWLLLKLKKNLLYEEKLKELEWYYLSESWLMELQRKAHIYFNGITEDEKLNAFKEIDSTVKEMEDEMGKKSKKAIDGLGRHISERPEIFVNRKEYSKNTKR